MRRISATTLGGMVGVLLGAVAAAAAGPAAPVFEKHVVDTNLPAISADMADVDGDGKLDIVAAGGPSGWHSPWANLVYWYRAPSWERKPVCRLDTNAVILHLEAVNFSQPKTARSADALPPAEITLTDGFLGDIWWYRYDRAKEAWTGTIMVDEIKFAHGAAAGDIDRDGYTDLLTPTQRRNPTHGMIWARNPGEAAAREKKWPTHAVATNFIIACAHYVRLADVNSDGRLDALHGASCGRGWFGYWLQGPDPRQPWEAHALPAAVTNGTNLDAADLNGDGKMDFVGTEGHGVGVWWFPAPDYKPTRIDNTLKSAHCLALGDFNGDRTIDVVSCGYESRQVACFLNDGRGTFTRLNVDTNQCAYDARAVDLDLDGDLDILLSGQRSGNLVWYENRTRM